MNLYICVHTCMSVYTQAHAECILIYLYRKERLYRRDVFIDNGLLQTLESNKIKTFYRKNLYLKKNSQGVI